MTVDQLREMLEGLDGDREIQIALQPLAAEIRGIETDNQDSYAPSEVF